MESEKISMKIVPVYGNQVFVVPVDGVCRKLSTATREELAVLLSVLSAPEVHPAERAAQLNLTEKTLLDAVTMWQRAGVIALSDTTATSQNADFPAEELAETSAEGDSIVIIQQNAAEKKIRRAKKNVSTGSDGAVAHTAMHARRELPHYSSEALAKYIEETPGMRELVDCCQNISGEMFSPSALEIIVGMHDYLALTPEYIMLLFSHAKKLGKNSVRYIETTAIGLSDEGITSYQELEERLMIREKRETMDAFVRGLFGLRTRALIPKEREMIDNWIFKMHYDRDIISRAYEITVTNTGKPAIAYANRILENWFEAGLKTLAEINEALEEYKTARESQPAVGTSFNTDDFFEAAIRRSYET